jgi:drug/metabolite transporter (DMT)-like permease
LVNRLHCCESRAAARGFAIVLVARFSLTGIVMGCAALFAAAQWPGVRRAAPHLLAGGLMQGIYLCASYWAISRGLAAGVMALLGALQPLFTALLAVSWRRCSSSGSRSR